jgi:hypothetical protein
VTVTGDFIVRNFTTTHADLKLIKVYIYIYTFKNYLGLTFHILCFFIFYVLTLQENNYCKQGPLESILLHLP